MSNGDVYLSPKFLKDDYDNQHSERKHRHKSRRSHRKDEEPVLDSWTIVPLVLAFCLVILSSILIYKKSHSLPFCSKDEDFRECIPCPSYASCSRGKAKCNNGFILSGKACVADTEAELKAVRLALKIGKYIASKPNDMCNESIGIKYEEILSNFRNEQFFHEALERMENTIYDVHVRNDLYISYNPTLDTKCRAYIFVKENKESLILLCVALILILILLITIRSKIRTRKIIKESAINVIEKLKEQKGKKILVDDLEPLETDEVYKHWQKVIDIVEDNEAIEIYNTEKGKAWKYSP